MPKVLVLAAAHLLAATPQAQLVWAWPAPDASQGVAVTSMKRPLAMR